MNSIADLIKTFVLILLLPYNKVNQDKSVQFTVPLINRPYNDGEISYAIKRNGGTPEWSLLRVSQTIVGRLTSTDMITNAALHWYTTTQWKLTS